MNKAVLLPLYSFLTRCKAGEITYQPEFLREIKNYSEFISAADVGKDTRHGEETAELNTKIAVAVCPTSYSLSFTKLL